MSGGREDFAAIAETVQTYVEGMAGADEKKLQAVFHPKASIVGYLGGEFAWDSLDEFLAAVKSVVESPDPDPQWTLQSIDIVGDTAVARAATAVAGMTFTDTLSLLRVEGNWVIGLRSATALAHLMAKRGEGRAAHALLSGIYDWFTEAFGTRDLVAAKALLDSLEG